MAHTQCCSGRWHYRSWVAKPTSQTMHSNIDITCKAIRRHKGTESKDSGAPTLGVRHHDHKGPLAQAERADGGLHHIPPTYRVYPQVPHNPAVPHRATTRPSAAAVDLWDPVHSSESAAALRTAVRDAHGCAGPSSKLADLAQSDTRQQEAVSEKQNKNTRTMRDVLTLRAGEERGYVPWLLCEKIYRQRGDKNQSDLAICSPAAC